MGIEQDRVGLRERHRYILDKGQRSYGEEWLGICLNSIGATRVYITVLY